MSAGWTPRCGIGRACWPRRWASRRARRASRRRRAGAGAAGGVGYAAIAALGASCQPGIELMLELIGFAAALDGAELVVTGEGSLDEQTLHGKAPAGVAAAARRPGCPSSRSPGGC